MGCKGVCKQIKALHKAPISKYRTYGNLGGQRTTCTICEISYYQPEPFPDNRCLCCHFKLRVKAHCSRVKRRRMLLA